MRNMKFVDLEKYLGKNISVTLVRGLRFQRVSRHRGKLMRFTESELCLQTVHGQGQVWVARPRIGLDTIELIVSEQQEEE